MLLIKFSQDWADEFQSEGFTLMSETKWEQHKALVEKAYGDSSFEVYFGTNEAHEFNDAQDYIDSFEVVEIDDEQVDFLKSQFGDSFGIVPLCEPEIDDEDETDEDEESYDEDEEDEDEDD